jgi:hypothetical protein
MKKFLLFSAFLCTTLFVQKSFSQTCSGGSNCTITPTNIKTVATKVQTISGSCVTTVNVTFTIQNNNGFKWVPIYFYDVAIPAGVCGTEPSAHPDLLAFAMLERLNNGTFIISSNSINSLTPQTAYSLSATNLSGGLVQITLTDLKFTKAGACATSQTALYIGGANSGGSGANIRIQCYGSSNFTAYQLFTSGRINCTIPRSYTFNINTDYKVSGTSTPVAGKYDVYYDFNNNGLIDDGMESELATDVEFLTVLQTVEGVEFNSFSATATFASSDLGDVKTGSNLIVAVRPSSPGVADSRTRLANSCGVLPVKLKSFNASKQSSKVVVSWETADEINSKGFEIQRRVNNGAYETIGFVASKAGYSGTATYQFDDQSRLPQGSLYYRLRQIDQDDQARFSDIRLVMNSTRKLDVSVYPNPSKGAATVILPESNGKMDITLEDYTGRMLQRWNAFSSSNLQLNQLRPGIYLIRVQLKETGEQSVQRLLVQ